MSAQPFTSQLKLLASQISSLSTAELTAQSPLQDPILHAAGLTVDLSRSRINHTIVEYLYKLSQDIGLEEAIKALLSGDTVNSTENRAAHHSALRLPADKQSNPEVGQALAQMQTISGQLRSGEWRGYTGKKIEAVVNIGIGGSDLGPRMVCDALGSQDEPINVYFASNVDPTDLESILGQLAPETTLFVISSKTFSTTETLENALTAKAWLGEVMSEAELSRHLVAVSSNIAAATQFGIDEKNILPMWDWVGGRYSLWSAIGLPIAIALGFEQFQALLSGAHQLDVHFAESPLQQNLPVMLAFAEVFYINGCEADSLAVLPYCNQLRLFPDFLQQLTMESNGKSVSHEGETVDFKTCPTIWGSCGTIGQHSFHQLLHQGTEFIPVDFILPLKSRSDATNKQAHLVSNCLAQSKALTEGKSITQIQEELVQQGLNEKDAKSLAKHKFIIGQRPNTLIGMQELNAKTLGALIALYEHKVFVESIIWNINAFDQWGVELGKQLSKPIFEQLTTNSGTTDTTTQRWIDLFHSANKS